MNFREFKELFPESSQIPESDSYSIELSDAQVYLPTNTLSAREKSLLELVNIKYTALSRLSSWQMYLKGEGEKPNFDGLIRFLYFKVKDLKKENHKQWQDQLLSFFADATAFFWQNSEELVVVDNECTLSSKDLLGILMTMDSDFSSASHLLIGLTWSKEANIADLFAEEEKINGFISWHNKVMTIAQAALGFYTQHNWQESAIFKAFRKEFEGKDDTKELIINLYHVGGNVTQAAKSMFIHRNTLEYRIDKFMQTYHLNLHNIDDLVFSYLIFV